MARVGQNGFEQKQFEFLGQESGEKTVGETHIQLRNIMRGKHFESASNIKTCRHFPVVGSVGWNEV